MDWWQAILLGIVQGLTEFLPVSSSGHLMIFKELIGVDAEGFLDFTVTVHFATVLATIVVFWSAIWKLLKGFFQFKYNDETDYILKILVSLVPVMIVGFFFKDQVDAMSAFASPPPCCSCRTRSGSGSSCPSGRTTPATASPSARPPSWVWRRRLPWRRASPGAAAPSRPVSFPASSGRRWPSSPS